LKRTLILLVFIALLGHPVHSVQDWFETNLHPATFCIPCHQRFYEMSKYALDIPTPLKNREITTIFPCSKPGCHKNNKNIPLPKRWERHLGICGNCHPLKDGKYDIHSIHLNFSLLQPPWELGYPAAQNINLRNKSVECRICHATPEGYNSSIATVPPLNISILPITTKVTKPQWDNKCSYCHPAVKGAKRLHDVHEPVILKACPVCHTSRIFERKDFLRQVAGEKALLEKGLIEIKEEFFLIKEFRAYFSEIAEQLINAFLSIRGTEE